MRLPEAGPDALDSLAALCARSLRDPPGTEELRRSLFDPARPALVRGHPDTGVIATVVRGGRAFIRLLAVDPIHRGRGIGRALVGAAEADLRGFPSITVGSDAPDYLWPGIDVRQTAAICLLERLGYALTETLYNMSVDPRPPPISRGGRRPS